jgi:hypothetical protein
MAVQPRSANDLRGLKALVGILGALVVLGTALVIGIVIQRLYAKPAASAPAAVAGGSIALPGANLLGRGERIGGIAAAGGELAIWVSGPAGDRVLLLDPGTGKLTVAVSAPPQGAAAAAK